MSQNQKQQPRFMKDHEIALLVNRLRDIAVKFHNYQSLRERISHVIVDPLKGYWNEGPLNDHDEDYIFSPGDKQKVRDILLANGFEIKPDHTDLKEYVYKAYFALVNALRVNATPSAFWWANEQTDPHGAHYAVGVERAKLAMGDLTDDELANGVFMNGDGSNSSDRFFRPIAWLTAAEERIRWLSRQVTGLTDQLNQTKTELVLANEKLNALRVQYIRDGQAADSRYAELLKLRVVHVRDQRVFYDITAEERESVQAMVNAGYFHAAFVMDKLRSDAGRAEWDSFVPNLLVLIQEEYPILWQEIGELHKRHAPSLNADAGADVELINFSVFGYCPTCGAPGVSRERRPDGNDTCQNGHEYPSSQSLQTAQQKP